MKLFESLNVKFILFLTQLFLCLLIRLRSIGLLKTLVTFCLVLLKSFIDIFLIYLSILVLLFMFLYISTFCNDLIYICNKFGLLFTELFGLFFVVNLKLGLFWAG
jgi:hypothetical protein